MSAASLHAFKMLQKIQQRGDLDHLNSQTKPSQGNHLHDLIRSFHQPSTTLLITWLNESMGNDWFTEALDVPSLRIEIYLQTCWSSPHVSVGSSLQSPYNLLPIMSPEN